MLQRMDAALAERRCKAWAIWEPTGTQPADEPSRLDEFGHRLQVVEEKVRSCRRRLLEAVNVAKGALEIAGFQKRDRDTDTGSEDDAEDRE